MDGLEPTPSRKRSRRRYSQAFRQQILAECETPGISIASVALRNNINPNVIHNWRRKAREQQTQGEFLRLPSPGCSAAVSTPTKPTEPPPSDTVRIEVPTPRGQLVVHWPIRQLQHSIPWLRAITQ